MRSTSSPPRGCEGAAQRRNACRFRLCGPFALGHRCVGAKVNGKLVPLKTLFKSGDTMEILTNPAHKPSKDWLKFVVTSKAKTKIRQWVKEEQREQSIELGHSLLEKEMTKHDLSLSTMLKAGEVQALAKDFSFDTIDDLLPLSATASTRPFRCWAR